MELLLVDDHPALADGVKSMLSKESNWQITSAYSSKAALDLLKQKKFDLLLTDLNMPEYSGLELIQLSKALYPDLIMLIFTAYDLLPMFNSLVKAGVSGVLCKTMRSDQLISSIHLALQGEAIFPLHYFNNFNALRSDELYKKTISERELSIIKEVAKGLSNREVSRNLFISQRSVEHHLTQLFRKLEVTSRAEAVGEVRRLGLLPGE
ncbi:hypothetical protein PSTEL_06145 [Paenibacillus stellifer]|uniref:LuxR family transcriptional regulator n=1 Tax=Paenibacillus stellifer TaxID=169760 RepID=A0A089LRM2_9BACL|nr:response regulator transcription factor [Paenibacillus stellifer]AIQ62745.1 hypothetical protein PSTEL_06145 [Paenibacillus stellifer]